ncbi:hypothetical protein F4802DRAFT_588133 [Xylaria palmicola]|nr:hypothetical protein F4802DRAFT_588133 [Xylaria palmicola]
MSTLTFDSELMTYHQAAKPIPHSSHFVTVVDNKKTPMSFSIGNDSKFHLIRTGLSGENELVDFGTRLGYGSDVDFLHFDLSQSFDQTLYMAILIRDQGKKKLVVTKPIKPVDINSDKDLSDYIVSHTYDAKEANLLKIMVGNRSLSEKYPLVLVTFKVTRAIKNSEDISRVKMSSDYSSWSLSSDVKLPENADEIYDLRPTTVDISPGYTALYKNQNKTCLIFIGTEELFGNVAHVPISCTDGTSVVAFFFILNLESHY